ncbi:glycoside hydrolase family 88 protein [Bacteroides acidifaciens]|nr:glycoside hydrolase family 88 protein [Bacteroides acidifaciens]MBF0731181.1 glycoside hydrolase family 88 protein [Bacteroides acidifaciens]MBF0834569.1 glycoside hydrolase family 88 protein [Bacteroides acidifaciens]NDO53282.1 glucuronyl hydrolase [Bacteroides acidifaciens]TFU46128.1 glucuronyl hydrolase [Bacteroides acidifaciens]
MKRKLCVAVWGMSLLTACSIPKAGAPEWFENAVETSGRQLLYMAEQLENVPDTACFPRSVKEDGSYRLENAKDWTSGFYPGSMWLAYDLTGDEALAKEARMYTNRLEDIQYYIGNHDIGFMMFCSYGHALRLKPESKDKQILVNSSESLCARFSPEVGLIRSWDFGDWSYPVIIDNMMNLEMLFWASEQTGNSKYRDIAIAHADKTLKNHFRKDMTSYHVVSYSVPSGKVESKGTFQGYSDSSAWARGQAWGVYGYTMCYRFTKNPVYLEAAHKIVRFIMNNRPSEKDYIPYWDYNAPDIPNAPHDASAAAITASALLELNGYTDDKKLSDDYTEYAESILKQLSSPEYLAKDKENKGFILLHSVGSFPHNSEVDVPLNYADYYYLEALKRYKELKKFS